jgi:hypothetical protein
MEIIPGNRSVECLHERAVLGIFKESAANLKIECLALEYTTGSRG